MTGWADGLLLGLDLETDSPDPEDAHLITAAILHYAPGSDLERYQWVAKPRREIPEGAARIHGYTTERAEADGSPIEQVISDISSTLGKLWSWDCPMLTCNSPFDLTVVDRELGRALDSQLVLETLPPVIDTLLIDRMCDRYRSGSRRLADTCAHYGVGLDDAHDATADALATMRLAWKLARRRMAEWPSGSYGPDAEQIHAWKALAAGDLVDLYRVQHEWFRTHSIQLAAYFRTPRAVEKIERDHAAGLTTRDEADELIRTLPQRADDVECNADGWPMRRRS